VPDPDCGRAGESDVLFVKRKKAPRDETAGCGCDSHGCLFAWKWGREVGGQTDDQVRVCVCSLTVPTNFPQGKLFGGFAPTWKA
jgi:hypothetical protein